MYVLTVWILPVYKGHPPVFFDLRESNADTPLEYVCCRSRQPFGLYQLTPSNFFANSVCHVVQLALNIAG